MPRWRSPGFLALILLLPIATLFYLQRSLFNLTNVLQLQEQYEQLSSHPAMSVPKITIIAIWNTKETPALYLPNFFASVKANPLIDLLFIVVDKRDVGRCHETIPKGAPNIKEVCFSVEEYWDLHADFLCNHWGCEGDDRVVLIDKIYERFPRDYHNSFFRPFRSAIFARWMDPNTKIWGWCDMDVMFGNFERAFPWDVAESFDMVIPGPSGIIPQDDLMLFIPGHLAFFRNTAQFTAQFLEFPNFQSLDAFLHLPWIDPAAEEVDYSNFAFYHSNLTFVMFPALVYSSRYISTPGRGVYAVERGKDHMVDLAMSGAEQRNSVVRSSINMMLDRYEEEWKPVPTFSEAGVQYPVELREGVWDGSIWFPRHFAVDFLIDHSKIAAYGRRFIIRREPGGSVFDCEEPNIREINFKVEVTTEGDLRASSVMALEMLYVHFQGEKYSPWWSLPEHPISQNEVLYVDKEVGAEIWDASGNVAFRTTLSVTSNG